MREIRIPIWLLLLIVLVLIILIAYACERSGNVMLDADQINRILAKVAQLDPNDAVRRGIEEYAGKWWKETQESRRQKIERELLKRAQRIAY